MAEKLYRLINDKKKNDFLMTYIKCGTIAKAARKCKIDRTTHYQWMRQNEHYREAFAIARQRAGDLLEEEAHRRAMEGYEQPIYYKGEKVGSRKVYSDYLLVELLRGAKPEIYRPSTEVNTNVNINLSDAVQAARERVANANKESESGD